jgi:zinc protease
MALEVMRLPNGVKCILDRRKGAGVVAVQVWVKVGSRNEDDRVAGITHFIEHLIFKGTEGGECYEIAPRIEALGGSINAFTSYDNTVYHIVVPCKSFETGLELLAGSVRHPAFPEEELEKEKKVVIEEIKMGEDDPQRKLFNELFSASYPDHPYGRPIIGYRETVLSIGRSHIVSYFNEHYTPGRTAIVVVGDFDGQKVRELLTRHLSEPAGQEGRAGKGPRAARSSPGNETRVRIIEKEVEESYLALAYPIGPLVHPDTAALDVLGKILADGDSSRLQATLKHARGLVTDAESYVFTPRENGLFVIVATFKGRDYEHVTAAIEGELGRIWAQGVEPWEVEKAQNLVRASHIYGAESVQGKARLIGGFEALADDPAYEEKYLRAIDRVTAGEVVRVLDRYLIPGQRRLAALLPGKKENPSLFQLENGLRCVWNRNTASPSFSFMIGFVGGLKEEREGQNGSFNVLARMLLRGTKDLDAQAIARRIDTLAGGISPLCGKNVFGLSGRFLKKDLSRGLGLLKDLLLYTAVREDELGKVKEEVFSEMRRRDDEPSERTFMEMNRALFEGHPYARDQMGSIADVAGLAREDVEGLYRGYVGPGGAVLALSGDVERKEAEALVRALFSDWSGGDREMKKVVHSLGQARDRVVFRDMFQTHMIFGFVGPGLIDRDRYPVEVMHAILSGMGGRIHRRLREEHPYAYAVTFFNQQAYEVGALGIYIGTDRTLLEEVEAIVRAEIEAIRIEGFTEEEVARAKEYMVGNHSIRMQTNSAIASAMCLDTLYGLRPNFFKVWPEKVERVSRDEVNVAARTYLLPDRMVKVRVGPGEEKG